MIYELHTALSLVERAQALKGSNEITQALQSIGVQLKETIDELNRQALPYVEELANRLDGVEYGEVTVDSYAKEHGLTVIFGHSDDLLELLGNFDEEFDAWGGAEITGGEGFSITVTSNEDSENESFWEYEFDCKDCPKKAFRIMEDGELYSFGYVFYAPGVTWEVAI